jgi:hypothetical protein
LQLVRECAGKTLHDVLRCLREAVHEPDDAAGCFQRLRQKDRQDRIKHLRRNIGEQARGREEERVSGKPGKVALDRTGHGQLT